MLLNRNYEVSTSTSKSRQEQDKTQEQSNYQDKIAVCPCSPYAKYCNTTKQMRYVFSYHVSPVPNQMFH